jgi:chromosome segregation ATPase
MSEYQKTDFQVNIPIPERNHTVNKESADYQLSFKSLSDLEMMEDQLKEAKKLLFQNKVTLNSVSEESKEIEQLNEVILSQKNQIKEWKSKHIDLEQELKAIKKSLAEETQRADKNWREWMDARGKSMTPDYRKWEEDKKRLSQFESANKELREDYKKASERLETAKRRFLNELDSTAGIIVKLYKEWTK